MRQRKNIAMSLELKIPQLIPGQVTNTQTTNFNRRDENSRKYKADLHQRQAETPQDFGEA